jgi:hypothetical protein
MQHYVIKCVSDFWLVSGFPRLPMFPTAQKMTATIQLKYC